jgi:hypothetical protein
VRTKYDDSLAIVEWHPYAYDTFNINPDDSLRVDLYQHNPGQPSLVLDGHRPVEMPSDPGQYYSGFDNAVSVAKSESTFVTLLVDSAKADSIEGHIFFRLTVDSVTPGTAPTLCCVVTEDSLVDLLGGVYFRIPVRFVPDRHGLPINLDRGDTLDTTLAFSTAGYRTDKLGAAVFVEEASWTEERRVLQAATIRSFVMTEEK